jgi:hypothetical protein
MRKLLRASTCVLVFASAGAAGAGQITPIRLGAHGELGIFPPLQSVATLRDGRFATLWSVDSFNGKGFLQYIAQNGVLAFPAPGILVATTRLSVVEAAVVAHAREGVLVAVAVDPGDGNSRLMVQWFDRQGRPRWGTGAFAAPVPGPEYQQFPFLLASPDGGAFVCFERTSLVNIDEAVYCQRFSPAGKRLWGRGGARATRSALVIEETRALAANDGGVIVFWRDLGSLRGAQADITIRGQRLGPDGGRRWGDEARMVWDTRMAEPGGYSPPEFAVVSDGAGGAIVAFDNHEGARPLGSDTDHVTVQRMNGAGDNLWGEGVSALPSGPPQSLGSLIPGPDGGAFVGAFVYPSQSDGVHLRFQRLTASGQPVWPAEGVPVVDPSVSGSRDYEAPGFGCFDGTTLRIVWEYFALGNSPSEIHFTALDAAGNRLIRRAGIPLTDAMEFTGLHGFACNPDTGVSFLIWEVAADSDILGLFYTPTVR